MVKAPISQPAIIEAKQKMVLLIITTRSPALLLFMHKLITIKNVWHCARKNINRFSSVELVLRYLVSLSLPKDLPRNPGVLLVIIVRSSEGIQFRAQKSASTLGLPLKSLNMWTAIYLIFNIELLLILSGCLNRNWSPSKAFILLHNQASKYVK